VKTAHAVRYLEHMRDYELKHWPTALRRTESLQCILRATSLHRSSSDHSTDAARSQLSFGASGRHGSKSATGVRAATKQLHVAAAIDRRDRQTDGRTDTVLLHRCSRLEAVSVNESITKYTPISCKHQPTWQQSTRNVHRSHDISATTALKISTAREVKCLQLKRCKLCAK